MPRRRRGALFDLETRILSECAAADAPGIHGFAIAKALAEDGDDRRLTATGTLYRALHRLETMALIAGSWEDPAAAAAAGRPRRRLYRITAEGARTLAAVADQISIATPSTLRPGLAT